MKIYICGPMSGLPQSNYPAFNDAAHRLVDAGFEVLNPVDNEKQITPEMRESKQIDWNWYMRKSLKQIALADGFALLPGVEKSRGAQIEINLARNLDIPLQSVEAWTSSKGRQRLFLLTPIFMTDQAPTYAQFREHVFKTESLKSRLRNRYDIRNLAIDDDSYKTFELNWPQFKREAISQIVSSDGISLIVEEQEFADSSSLVCEVIRQIEVPVKPFNEWLAFTRA